ncbi:Protein VAC14-like protein [Smittium mucronatum]|uniref:Protein VAC14-like protein n=1 Tax=Smittium mucronatum TaxID=133383 RepID=A0A1R0GX75_9FUNG|nr:Protein VAC14-like protein [Smittium mucronatum]
MRFIPIQIGRGIIDKVYDKRKQNALLLEDYVRELISENDKNSISSILIEISEEFMTSSKDTTRSGGLIALAACSIALGPDCVYDYLDLIITPILSSLSDLDPKVRYYSCEALYNVAKVSRGLILGWFNEIIDMLSRVTADPSQSVKDSADYVDRLIKDIVTEEATTYLSLQNPEPSLTPNLNPDSNRKNYFSLERFIPLLSERMHTFKAATRLYLIEWIRILDSVPGLDLIRFLPNFLDQLIRFLSDPKDDVRLKASNVLIELLREVEECAGSLELANDLWSDSASAKAETINFFNSRDEHYKSYHKKTISNITDGYNTIGEASEEIKMASRRKKIRDERKECLNKYPNFSSSKEDGLSLNSCEVYVDHAACLDILVVHLHSNDQEILATCLNWVFSFSYICPKALIALTPPLVNALLPLSSHSVPSIRDLALKINKRLQYLVCSEPSSSNLLRHPLQSPLKSSVNPLSPSYKTGSHDFLSNIENDISSELVSNVSNVINYTSNGSSSENLSSLGDFFSYESVVDVIIVLFENNVHENTKVEGLKWLLLLHRNAPNKILSPEESSFSFLLKVLNDPSEKVVKLVLELFAQIVLFSENNSHPADPDYDIYSSYLARFCKNLLLMFLSDPQMLHSRMPLIIRQLCLVLDAERVFRVFSLYLHAFLSSYNILPTFVNFDTDQKNRVGNGFLGSINSGLQFSSSGYTKASFLYNNDGLKNKSGDHLENGVKWDLSRCDQSVPFDYLSFGQEIIQQLTWILISAPEASTLRRLLRMNNSELTKYYFDQSNASHRPNKYQSSQSNTKADEFVGSNNQNPIKDQSQQKHFSSIKELNPLNKSSPCSNLDNVESQIYSNHHQLDPQHISYDAVNNHSKNVVSGSKISIESSSVNDKKLQTELQNFSKKKINSDYEPNSSRQKDGADSIPKINQDKADILKFPNLPSKSTQEIEKPNTSQKKPLSKLASKLPQISRLYRPGSPASSNQQVGRDSNALHSLPPQIMPSRPESPVTVSPVMASGVAKTSPKNSSNTVNTNTSVLNQLKSSKQGFSNSISESASKASLNQYKGLGHLPNISNSSSAALNYSETHSPTKMDTSFNSNGSVRVNIGSESLPLISKKSSIDSSSKEPSNLSKNLFESLFISWSCSPVSTLVLCFLSQRYELSYLILEHMSQGEIPHSFLSQLDVLVQLLESPVFSFLRMQLLRHNDYPYLSASLYGLLMLLPQSVAFLALKNRLGTIPNVHIFDSKFPLKSGREYFDNDLKENNISIKYSSGANQDLKKQNLIEGNDEKNSNKYDIVSDSKTETHLKTTNLDVGNSEAVNFIENKDLFSYFLNVQTKI